MPRAYRGLADIVRLMPLAGDRLEDWVRVLDADRLPTTPDEPDVQIQLPADEDALDPAKAWPFQTPKSQKRTPLQAPQYAVLQAEPWVSHEALRPIQTPAEKNAPEIEYGPLKEGKAPPCYLVQSTQLWPALRRQRATRAQGVDVQTWTRLSAKDQWPRYVPKKVGAKTWSHLVLVWDRSFHLIPFQRDFELFEQQLRRWALAQKITVLNTHGAQSRFKLPTDADMVMVLSDMGASTDNPHHGAQAWLHALGPALKRQLPVQAWVTAHANRISASLVAKINVIPWSETSSLTPVRPQRALPVNQVPQPPNLEPLRDRMAMALACQPALLRRLRWLCEDAAGHPEWESMLWASPHKDMVAGERVVQWRPAAGAERRKQFQSLSPNQQLAVWQALHVQHGHQSRSTLMMERLLVATHASETFKQNNAVAIQEAWDWFAALKHDEEQYRQQQRQSASSALQEYLRDALSRVDIDQSLMDEKPTLWAALGHACDVRPQTVSDTAWLQVTQAHQREDDVFPWAMVWDMKNGKSVFRREPLIKQGHEDGKHLGFLSPTKQWTYAHWASGHDTEFSSPAREKDSLILADAQGMYAFHIGTIKRQPWQERLGRDRYGVFCEVLFKGVSLRLRYIPPGTFLMGSPDGVGHANEHPQHPVTITQGYWLADTPCTQALWQAVMGNNPSHFSKGSDAPRRPVENVSYIDVQDFLKKLQALLPVGVEAALPTEAEWEYACRAGTSTTYWWGDGFDPDMANTNDKRDKDWNAKGGTSPVDRYPANPWGLYDMLGNVWEWCADDQRSYDSNIEIDPKGAIDTRVFVVRGNSWFDHPEKARAAFRIRGAFVLRGRVHGFRLCLRSSSPGPEGSA